MRSIALPKPELEGAVSVERALRERRSVRRYAPNPLDLAEVSQLLWAAQGVTGREGVRTAPSAGALYPIELFLVAGRVENLDSGVYQYRPTRHSITHTAEGDRREALMDAALGERFVKAAPITLVVAALFERTTGKYASRGERYVYFEVGHVVENVYLQAVALGLGTVVLGAFDDAPVRRCLGIPAPARPLALMPVGRQRSAVTRE